MLGIQYIPGLPKGGTTQAMPVRALPWPDRSLPDMPASQLGLILDSLIADVTHDEIDRRVSAGLAGNFPAVTAFQHRICGLLPRFVDHGALGLSLIRPDVFFTPYFPAVFFATAFGGFRIGIATALAGGALGVAVNFGDAIGRSCQIGAAADLLVGLRPHDLGRRALSIDRRAAAARSQNA